MPETASSPSASGTRIGLLAIAAAASLWALGAVVAADLFEAGITPFELTEARAVVAALGLAALIARGTRSASGPAMPRSSLIAFGLSIALVTACYYVAIDRLAVAVAIVIQYTAPVLVVTYMALIARKSPSPRVVASLIGAFVGVALVSGFVTSGLGEVDGVGLLAAAGSSVFFASYTILSQQAERAYGPLGAMLRAFLVSAAFWIGVQVFNGWPEKLFAPEHLPQVLFVGIAGTLIPFGLFVWGIGRVRAERASIAATLEPVLAAIAAWVWLDQPLGAVQVVGGILVVGAVLSLQMAARDVIAPPDI